MNRKVWWLGAANGGNESGWYSGNVVRLNDKETQALIMCNETEREVWIPVRQLTQSDPFGITSVEEQDMIRRLG